MANYGITAAKARILLDQADVALIYAADGKTVFGLDPKIVRASIESYPLDFVMPTKLYEVNGVKNIELCSPDAIANAEKQAA